MQALWRILEPLRVLMSDDDRNVADEVENQVDDVFFTNFRLANGAIGHMAVARSARGTQIGVPGGTNVFGSEGALSDGKVFSGDGEAEDVLDRFRREAPGTGPGRSDARRDHGCVRAGEPGLAAGDTRRIPRRGCPGRRGRSTWR